MAKKPYQSKVRVFKSDFMEKWFTHVHPIIPLLLWGPVSAFLIWRSLMVHEIGMPALIAMAGVALFVWTLTEYVAHRYLFHFDAVGPFQERLLFLLHGIHHDDPIDPTRLVMPPLMSITLAVVLYPMFRVVLGPVWIDPFFAFFLIGYLCYDYTHYAVHHFTPRTKFGKMLKQHHMLHHYVSPEARYGVSSPVWDVVFGTMKQVPNKEQMV